MEAVSMEAGSMGAGSMGAASHHVSSHTGSVYGVGGWVGWAGGKVEVSGQKGGRVTEGGW
jgi:hypothetical protein